MSGCVWVCLYASISVIVCIYWLTKGEVLFGALCNLLIVIDPTVDGATNRLYAARVVRTNTPNTRRILNISIAKHTPHNHNINTQHHLNKAQHVFEDTYRHTRARHDDVSRCANDLSGLAACERSILHRVPYILSPSVPSWTLLNGGWSGRRRTIRPPSDLRTNKAGRGRIPNQPERHAIGSR